MKRKNKNRHKNKNQEVEIKNNINRVVIERDGKKTYFEIIDSNGILHTYDVGEGVAAILMTNNVIEDSIWNINLTDIDKQEISSIKALYWLSGGNSEWVNLNNYKLEWSEASLMFKKKFGSKITRIIRRSKTLLDIKKEFEKHLSLPILYEFAIKNKII